MADYRSRSEWDQAYREMREPFAYGFVDIFAPTARQDYITTFGTWNESSVLATLR